MIEKEFTEKYLEKIRKQLDFAINNNYSDFYRKKYQNLNIDPGKIESYEDFAKIPFLTKDEILSAEPKDRLFVPSEEVVWYSFSSGTTNAIRPLVVSHSSYEHENGKFYFDEKILKSLGVNKVIGLLTPTSAVLQKILAQPNRTIPFIPIDVNKPSLMAKIVAEMGTEGIISTPTTLYHFTQELIKTDFCAEDIKWVTLVGEYASNQKVEYFKNIFTKAKFYYLYGNTEIGGSIGYRCETLNSQAKQSIYHPSQNDLVEVVNSEGLDSFDEVGEVVYTHLSPKALPLIRYRTADMAIAKENKCPCGNNVEIDVGGRKDFDVLKFNGTVIHSRAIESALSGLKDQIKLEFRMHVYERHQGKEILPKLILEIVPNGKIYESKIAQIIQDQLFLTSDKTMSDLVKAGIYLPLKIRCVDKIENGSKTRSIITHF